MNRNDKFLNIIFNLIIFIVPVIFYTGANNTILIKYPVFIILLSAFFFVYMMRKKTIVFEKVSGSYKYLMPMIIYILLIMISSVFRVQRTWHLSFVWFMKEFSLAILMLLIFENFSRLKLKYIVNTFIIMVFVICSYGLLQKFGLDFFDWQQFGTRRIISSFANPNLFSAFLVGTLPIVLWKIVNIKDVKGTLTFKKIRFFDIITIIGFFLSISAIFLTQTRAGLIALAVGGVILLISNYFLKGKLFKFKKVKPLIILILVFFVIILIVKKDIILTPVSRLVNVSLSQTKSTDFRTLAYPSVLKGVKDNVFTGVSPGNFFNYFPLYKSNDFLRNFPSDQIVVMHAHSEFFEVAFELGIVGLILFLWMIFFIIKSGYRDQNPFKIFLTISFIMLLITNLFSVNMRYFPSRFLFYTLAGLIIGNIKVNINNKKPDRKGWLRIIPVILILIWGIFISFMEFKSDILLRAGNREQYFKRQNNALEKYTAASVTFSSNHFAGYNMINLAYILKDYNKNFLLRLRLFNEEFPYFKDTHLITARIYTDLEDFEKAEAEFIIEESISTYTETLYSDWGYMKFQEIMKTDGVKGIKRRKSEILKIYKKGLDINPGNVVLLDNTGNLYTLLGNYQEALMHFEKAFTIKNDDYRLIAKIIDIKIKLAEYKDANDLFLKYNDKISKESRYNIYTKLKQHGFDKNE